LGLIQGAIQCGVLIMPKPTNEKIYERLAVVETKLDTLTRTLDRVVNRDLAFLEERIGSLERKFYIAVGALAAIQLALQLYSTLLK